MRGHSGKKIAQKSRNSCTVNGRYVGSQAQLTQSVILRNPRTKYKRSKNVFSVTSIALILANLRAIVIVSCAVSVVRVCVVLFC